MHEPPHAATENVEVIQSRIQAGWGSPLSHVYKGIPYEVALAGAPEKGDNVTEVDVLARDGDGWTFTAFDRNGEKDKDGRLPVLFEETDRKVFGRKLAEHHIAKAQERTPILRDGEQKVLNSSVDQPLTQEQQESGEPASDGQRPADKPDQGGEGEADAPAKEAKPATKTAKAAQKDKAAA